MAQHTALDCLEKRGQRGYLFIIGDEVPYASVKRREVERVIGDGLQADLPIEEVLSLLERLYDVYFIIPKLTHHWNNQAVQSPWPQLLGQRVLRLQDPAGICGFIPSTIGIAGRRIDPAHLGSERAAAGAPMTRARAVHHAPHPR